MRGKRISPKEIEAAILEIPQVIDCSIEGIEDEIEGETLKATIVFKNDPAYPVNKESIVAHCSKRLALYKVPQVYEFREELTISATGKKIKKV